MGFWPIRQGPIYITIINKYFSILTNFRTLSFLSLHQYYGVVQRILLKIQHLFYHLKLPLKHSCFWNFIFYLFYEELYPAFVTKMLTTLYGFSLIYLFFFIYKVLQAHWVFKMHHKNIAIFYLFLVFYFLPIKKRERGELWKKNPFFYKTCSLSAISDS